MDSNIPRGTPPPAYTHLPATLPQNLSPIDPAGPPSPTLTELEIKAFGRPLANIYPPACPSQPNIPSPTRHSLTPPSSPATQPTVTAATGPVRGAKRKATETQPLPPPMVFELLVEVPQPDKKVKTGGRSKTVKSESWRFGPKNVAVDITWDAFLQLVAELSSCSVPALVVSSFTWKFLTPKNSPNLPLSSTDGHKSFLGHVQAKIQKSGSAYVVLSMHKPLANQSAAPPWVSTAVNTVANLPNAEADEASDDDSGTQLKRARFDEEVESILDEIKEKYPPGLCSSHPDIACFHYKVNNLHFDLGLRARCLVWAAAIRDQKATLTKILLGSNFFKADQTLKTSKRVAEPSTNHDPTPPDAPSTPVHKHEHPTHPYPAPHPPYPYYSPYSMPPSLPPPFFSPYPFPNQPFPHAQPHQYPHSTPSHSLHPPPAVDDPRSSSPPMPDFDVQEFCKTYGLNPKACTALENMGFAGDSLENVPSSEWKDHGLGFLEWQRILNAVKKYRRDLRK